jgi:hypothetical protein
MAAVVSGLSFGQEKLGLNHRLPFQKDGDHPTQIFESCVGGGLWQEIRDQKRPLSLTRDDLGSLPNSGSIGGITSGPNFGEHFTIAPSKGTGPVH